VATYIPRCLCNSSLSRLRLRSRATLQQRAYSDRGPRTATQRARRAPIGIATRGTSMAGLGVFRATGYLALDPARPVGEPARWASGTSRWVSPTSPAAVAAGTAVVSAVSGRLLPPRPAAAHQGREGGWGGQWSTNARNRSCAACLLVPSAVPMTVQESPAARASATALRRFSSAVARAPVAAMIARTWLAGAGAGEKSAVGGDGGGVAASLVQVARRRTVPGPAGGRSGGRCRPWA